MTTKPATCFVAVLPDGREVTRTSKAHAFTHCWAFRFDGSGYDAATEWAVGGWATSESLATKAIPGYAHRHADTRVILCQRRE